MVWECETDKGLVTYSALDAQALEAAFAAGSRGWCVKVRGGTNEVDVSSMMQRNPQTDVKRKVVRSLKVICIFDCLVKAMTRSTL